MLPRQQGIELKLYSFSQKVMRLQLMNQRVLRAKKKKKKKKMLSTVRTLLLNTELWADRNRSSFCESWVSPYSKSAQTEYSILFIIKKLLSPLMPSIYSLPLSPDLNWFTVISLSPKETKDHSHQSYYPGEPCWIQLPKVLSYLLLSGD